MTWIQTEAASNYSFAVCSWAYKKKVEPTTTLESIAHLRAVPGGFCCLRLPQELLEAHQLFAEPWWLGNQALLFAASVQSHLRGRGWCCWYPRAVTKNSMIGVAFRQLHCDRHRCTLRCMSILDQITFTYFNFHKVFSVGWHDTNL